MKEKVSAEDRVREIRRKTRKKYSSEEKVRIVLEGLRGEESIAAPVPTRRNSVESVLPVEQGVSRGRQKAAGWGYEAGSHIE